MHNLRRSERLKRVNRSEIPYQISMEPEVTERGSKTSKFKRHKSADDIVSGNYSSSSKSSKHSERKSLPRKRANQNKGNVNFGTDSVFKVDILIDYNKTVLDKFSEQINTVADKLQSSVEGFKSLDQHLSQPQRWDEEFKLHKQSIQTLLKDLEKIV